MLFHSKKRGDTYVRKNEKMEQCQEIQILGIPDDCTVLHSLPDTYLARQGTKQCVNRRMDNLLGRLRRHWNTYKQKQSEEDGGNDTN